ncbi:MAG: ParB/RepB/Spo0J family partition protein [Patescibacteria group bacterium]|nr:ParB/RepB/Spo0J family partition protein [Patescibacteria group bacterium]
MTAETLTHPCAVKDMEVLRGVCLACRADPLNRLTICDKYNCHPPWNFDGGDSLSEPEKDRGNGRGSGKPAENGLKEVISPILEGNVPGLSVSDLFPDPDQPRQTFYEDDLGELGKSILEHGQMLPVIVLKEGERFRIIDGERRWRACQKMGIKKIYAIIVKNLKIDKFLVSTICNFGREGHTYIDTARAVSRAITIIEGIAKKRGDRLSREEVIKKVADGCCKSAPWVYQYLSLSRLDPRVQKLVGNGDLPVVVAVEVSKADEPEDQVRLAGEVVDGKMSANFARQFVRREMEEKGLSSVTRKREHSPKDDYRILRNFVNHALDGLNIILGWGPLQIIGLFYNRESKDKKRILEYLDKTIAKLQKLRDTIHNEGSIRNEVKDSVQKLWEADKPDSQEEEMEE